MTDERSDTETLPASDDAGSDEATEPDDARADEASADASDESSDTVDEETPDVVAAGVEDESDAPSPAEQVSEAVTEEASEAIGESDPAPETTAEGTEALAKQAVEEIETVPEEQAEVEEQAEADEGAAPPAETPEAEGGETEGDEKASDPQAEITESADPETAARSALGLGEKIEEEGLRPEEAAAILEAAAKEEEAAKEAEEEEALEAPDLEDADLVDVVEEEPSEPSPYDRPGDWYVVHTYSGYEKKVKSNVESRVKSLNMEGRIHEVVIPMDDVIEFKGGKKTVVQKKVFPGYLLVRMTLDDNSWGAIRNTPGVTGFVGSGAKPTPLSRKEVESILRVRPEDETKKARPRLEFEVGDQVRVTAGPFADFNGLIDEINVDQSTLKVLVNIFGRETPVTLEFSDVAKL